MSVKRTGIRLLLMGVVLAGLGGCAIAVDLLNPAFPAALGLDPATIIPREGTVLVAFNNGTRSQATFFAFEAPNAEDLASGSRNFSITVEAGQVRNEVLECPVDLFTPGTLGADLSLDSTAAIVLTGDAAGEAVAYGGNPLTQGDAYECGDVIEVRLTPVGTGDAAGFALAIQIIPGG